MSKTVIEPAKRPFEGAPRHLRVMDYVCFSLRSPAQPGLEGARLQVSA